MGAFAFAFQHIGKMRGILCDSALILFVGGILEYFLVEIICERFSGPAFVDAKDRMERQIELRR